MGCTLPFARVVAEGGVHHPRVCEGTVLQMLVTRYFFVGEFKRFEPELESCRHEEKSFAPGEYICRPAERLDKVFYLMSGFAQLSVLHESGGERVFGFWGPGSIYPLIANEQEFALEYSIIFKAMEGVDALVIDLPDFKNLLVVDPELGIAAIDHYGRFANTLLFDSVTDSYETIEMRLASFLYSYLLYMPNKECLVKLPQDTIASVIGTSRVSVARVLGEFRKLGLVKTVRGGVRVLDRPALKEFVSDLVG